MHQDTFQQVQNEADVDPNPNLGLTTLQTKITEVPKCLPVSRNGDLHYSAQGSYPRFGQQYAWQQWCQNWYGSQHDPGGAGDLLLSTTGVNELQAVDNERNNYAGMAWTRIGHVSM